MDDRRILLKHFLAGLAYRTQKALRGAPADFSTFRAAPQVRTPHELIRHMDSVLGYARTFFVGGNYRLPVLPELVTSPQIHFQFVVGDGAYPLANSAHELIVTSFHQIFIHFGSDTSLMKKSGVFAKSARIDWNEEVCNN